MHNLQSIREQYGFTRQDLVELSGIAYGTIAGIENNAAAYKKTHDTVAMALADALDVSVMEIFHPSMLTGNGRPAHTGKPIGHHTAPKYTIHRTSTCNMETYTGSGKCTYCDQPLPASASIAA